MSATGRSDVRRADDFYATPAFCTRAILPRLSPFSTALDPCAGEGAILKVLDDSVLKKRWSKYWGIELDHKRAMQCRQVANGCTHADALTCPNHWWLDVNEPFDLIITNPPFSLAQEFIEKALASGAKEIAFLLRLNFLGSQKRAAFWKKHPCEIYVLPKRPSFTENGKTDATEFAWYVWRKDSTLCNWGMWSILDINP